MEMEEGQDLDRFWPFIVSVGYDLTATDTSAWVTNARRPGFSICTRVASAPSPIRGESNGGFGATNVASPMTGSGRARVKTLIFEPRTKISPASA
jgi:hypothetical protein